MSPESPAVNFEVLIDEPADNRDRNDSGRGNRSTKVEVRGRSLQYSDRLGRTVVLDFDRRRRLHVDRPGGRFVDESMFSTVGLRHIELPNREHIRKVIEAGGGDGSMFAPTAVEHQLSVRDYRDGRPATTISVPETQEGSAQPGMFRSLFHRRKAADIERKIAGGRVVYRAGTTELLSHATEGADTPAAALAGFVQFIRYEYGGHPLILEQLERLGQFPREIRLHALQPGSFDRGAVILKATQLRERSSDEGPPDVAGLREVTSLDDSAEGDSVLDVQGSPAPAPDPKATDERLQAATEEIRAGNTPLNGVLSFFELTLETGAAMPPDMSEALRNCDDARVKILLSSMSATPDEKSTRAALAGQLRLREPRSRPSAVLDAFEAGLRTMLGERDLAKKLLTRAIATNPRLAGAYSQLGDAYLSSFDARRAWRCWEIARSIAPTHSMLRATATLENTLLGAHPEYF